MKSYFKIWRKVFLPILLFTACVPSVCAQAPALALMPMPNNVEIREGDAFKLSPDVTIGYATGQLDSLAGTLQKIIQSRTALQLPVRQLDTAPIMLSIDPELTAPEHYVLDVSNKAITLRGSEEAALFRGLMTLDQILQSLPVSSHPMEIMSLKIDDSPRFNYRAMMLDPARNFLPVEDVKFFIDQMAKFKFNVLQLHLTDDQGWRIEIRDFPELQSEKSYSQADIKEIVDYAAARYIEVVPEIDIPGHTAALLKKMPWLGCDNHQGEEIEVGTTVNRMLCAAKPQVYEVFEKIIGEISTLFPSVYIHLGGDEAAIPANWAQCESCQNLMAQLGYTNPSQLMIPFFGKMLAFVRQNGKKPILWCELDNIYPPASEYLFPYPDDITLVTWRARLTPTCMELTAKSGFPLIMAPGEYAYLDYPQMKGDLPEFNNWGMPVTTLERTYEFDPGYGQPDSAQSHIMGVMGTLWGEAIKDINRVNYMAFPRALALSEAGWTQMQNRDWSSFKSRLYPTLMQLMQAGVSFRVPFEIVPRTAN